MTTQNVVVYAPYPPTAPGAAGMRVHYLVQSLQKRGFIPHVLTPHDGKGNTLARKIRNLKPAFIIATSPPLPPLFWVRVAAFLCGCPFVLDAKEDGRAFEILSKAHHSLKERVFLRLRKWIYKSADYVWFLTFEDMELEMKRYKISPSYAEIVMNGTDPRILFDAKERKTIRSKWKVPSTTKLIGYAGSFGDEDLDVFLDEGLEGLPASVGVVLILSSDFTDAEQMKFREIETKLKSKMGSRFHRIENNIRVSEMKGPLSALDLGVIPWKDSLPTSIPVKTFDYAGAGIPILARAGDKTALARFLHENPTLGKAAGDWKSFRKARDEMIKKIPTVAARTKRSKDINEKWSRAKTMDRALQSLLPVILPASDKKSRDGGM